MKLDTSILFSFLVFIILFYIRIACCVEVNIIKKGGDFMEKDQIGMRR